MIQPNSPSAAASRGRDGLDPVASDESDHQCKLLCLFAKRQQKRCLRRHRESEVRRAVLLAALGPLDGDETIYSCLSQRLANLFAAVAAPASTDLKRRSVVSVGVRDFPFFERFEFWLALHDDASHLHEKLRNDPAVLLRGGSRAAACPVRGANDDPPQEVLQPLSIDLKESKLALHTRRGLNQLWLRQRGEVILFDLATAMLDQRSKMREILKTRKSRVVLSRTQPRRTSFDLRACGARDWDSQR